GGSSSAMPRCYRVRASRIIVVMMRCWLAVALCVLAVPAWADDALWTLLQEGGQVVLVRHGLTTPGVGDPPGFRLGDCATQRNLVDEGRREEARLGAGSCPHP